MIKPKLEPSSLGLYSKGAWKRRPTRPRKERRGPSLCVPSLGTQEPQASHPLPAYASSYASVKTRTTALILLYLPPVMSQNSPEERQAKRVSKPRSTELYAYLALSSSSLKRGKTNPHFGVQLSVNCHWCLSGLEGRALNKGTTDSCPDVWHPNPQTSREALVGTPVS